MLELAFILTNSFLLGIVAIFSPCLFPVLPTFLAFLSGRDEDGYNPLVLSGLVTLGIMVVFIALAVVFQTVLRFFALNYLLFRTGQGIVIVILGLFLISASYLDWNILNKLSGMADSMISRTENPYLMAFIIGLSFSLLAAPCAIIVFVTFFVMVSSQPLTVAILATVVFSISAGAPFFVLSLQVPRLKEFLVDRSSNIHKTFNLTASILIILTGLYLILDGLRLINIQLF